MHAAKISPAHQAENNEAKQSSEGSSLRFSEILDMCVCVQLSVVFDTSSSCVVIQLVKAIKIYGLFSCLRVTIDPINLYCPSPL